MQLGSSLVGAATGALAGGNTQSAALGQSVAVTAVTNNYLNHKRPDPMTPSEKENYENAVAACGSSSGRDQAACATRDALTAVSVKRDTALQSACGSGGSRDLCISLSDQAIEMGNNVYTIPIDGTNNWIVYANSPESGMIRFLNTATIGPIGRPDNFQDQAAKSTSEGLLLGATALAATKIPGVLGDIAETYPAVQAAHPLITPGLIGIAANVAVQQATTGKVDWGNAMVAGGTSAATGGWLSATPFNPYSPVSSFMYQQLGPFMINATSAYLPIESSTPQTQGANAINAIATTPIGQIGTAVSGLFPKVALPIDISFATFQEWYTNYLNNKTQNSGVNK
jgi:hypothetical protein